MDFVDPILNVVEKLYALCEEVKANKKRCARLKQRVEALEGVVKVLKSEGLENSPEVLQQALKELKVTLDLAVDVVQKYTSAGFFKRIRKAYHLKEDFEILNERLSDASKVLSLGMQIEHRQKLASVFAEDRCKSEDKEDWDKDRSDLETLLQKQILMQDVMDSTHQGVQELKEMLQTLVKPRVRLQDIREIGPDELEYDLPKKPIAVTPTHELYTGQFNKFPVAIKRYVYTANTFPEEVRSIFNNEVDTMKRFESPNILRMFGICIQDEFGSSPNYLIVMELCEMGSLRDVLSGTCQLSWGLRARMSLDAAQGLYRLHQSEQKFKVHGCINSFKFLVDSGYRVKLGCLELAKTETSLRRSDHRNNTSLNYCSPQQLGSVNYAYNKECEMYSFGIVLWEIAMRKTPFNGLTEDEIYSEVFEKRVMEPLPADCPGDLAVLIDACRSYEPFHRPTAGALVVNLRKVVLELGRN